jgi:DNA-binding SARP family transcriptional activator
LAAGDAASAAARLREALALWRGPPLADLALLEFAQPEIRRLEELRSLALMERIDSELLLGADAELIPELEQLVASNPLQERVRAQLMLALYRAGRQADALRSTGRRVSCCARSSVLSRAPAYRSWSVGCCVRTRRSSWRPGRS